MNHSKQIETIHFDIPPNLTMYDKLPYSINPDICTRENVRLNSGNIIKNYNVKLDEEKKIIDPIEFDEEVIESTAQEIPIDETSEEEYIEEEAESEEIEDNEETEPSEVE